MADPISIFGATASVVSVIDVLAKSISTIHNLRAQWKDADLALLSLTSQLAALRAALAKMKEWMESAMGDLDYQLVMDLDGSIGCCNILASTINRELGKLVTTSTGQLAMSSKARFVFQSTEMIQLQNMIDRQTSVLTLLLTACNTNTLAEQRKIVRKSSTRSSMKRVQADTASLIVHTDSASTFSSSTVNTSKLSVIFDFDSELFASKPYRGAIWKNMKLSIRSQKRREADHFTKESPFVDARDPAVIALLGIGASSKSTFLKQLKYISGDQFWNENPEEWRIIVFRYLVDVFQTFVNILTDDGINFWETRDSTLAYKYDNLLGGSLGEPEILPVGFQELFREVLAYKSVQGALKTTEASGLFENLDYFISHLDRLCDATFIPTYEDIIRVRLRTMGLSDTKLKIGSEEYRIFDVSGSRTGRKKWIHVFVEGCTILFFVSMSSYDQYLYDDQNLMSMKESLEVYEALWKVALPIMEQTTKILCFTKMDLFMKKISAGRSLVHYWPDYEGAPDDFSAAQAFFTKKFVDLHNPDQIHYLDATNTDDVRDVISKVVNCEVPYSKGSTAETDGI